MRDVIETIDGPINLNVCLSDTGAACPRKLECRAYPVWIRAQEALLDVLGSVRVTDLANTNNEQFPFPAFRNTGTGA
jgi:DNA-binding IscR family transcriptional regulator